MRYTKTNMVPVELLLDLALTSPPGLGVVV